MLNMDKFKVKRNDIFSANLGNENVVGSEMKGTHPVIIIGNNKGNDNSPTVQVAVITSNITKGKLPTHVEVGVEYGLMNDSVVLVEQIKTIDKKRIASYIGKASDELMMKVNEAIEIALCVGDYEVLGLSKVYNVIKDKIRKIHAYEATLITMKDTGLLNDVAVDILSSKWKSELEILEKYCTLNGIDYTSRYKPYGYIEAKVCSN